MRLTNRKTYSDLKNNAKKLQAKGMDVSISDLIYIKLAEYENAEEAADVQPICHGRWIYSDTPIFGNPYGRYCCSLCGSAMDSGEDNYCPCCGARMDGDAE